MSINPKLWISAMTVTLLASLWLILGKPVQVAAAPLANSSSNSCLTCHEDRYYLHDTGRYYCMTERADRCVNCHQGNPAAIDEAASHLGLIAHPQENNGEKCLQCHAQDVQVRLEKLASAATISRHLRVLRNLGMVHTTRQGITITYDCRQHFFGDSNTRPCAVRFAGIVLQELS
jgi:DNA-binding transcriptional ArsR family regulator